MNLNKNDVTVSQLAGDTVYLASQEIWYPRSIYPRILCTPWDIWHPLWGYRKGGCRTTV